MPRFLVKPIIPLEFKEQYILTGEVAVETIDKFRQTVAFHGLHDLDTRAADTEFEIDSTDSLKAAAQQILDANLVNEDGDRWCTSRSVVLRSAERGPLRSAATSKLFRALRSAAAGPEGPAAEASLPG